MGIDKSLTILIVDDNQVNLMLLKVALEKAGYHILMANNGSKARAMAEKSRPDLILLDIMMPGEDGFEVMRRLKANPATVSIPIILFSALEDLESKMRGFICGAVDYITKPFQIPEVLARVKLHLKLSIATNALIASQTQKLQQIQSAQQSMLVDPAEIPEAKFAVRYDSLQEAGGDIYDVFRISKDIFGYFVGDVSGHDIATSFLTASAKALLKQNCQPVYEPRESMRMINHVLCDILPDGKYLTACYARLNRREKSVTLVNAGHPPAFYVPFDREAELIQLEGDILGMFEDVAFGSVEMQVKSGDRFFLFTDGLIETSGDLVWTGGLQGLREASDLIRNCSVSEAVGRLKDIMMGDQAAPEDDVVVLGFEV